MRRRLQWLMGGRLVVAAVLLGGTLAVAVAGDSDFGSFTAQLLQVLIAGIFAASIAFAWQLGRGARDTGLARAQVAFDLMVITCLVYVTGGVASVFTFLYGVTILMAALLLGPGAAGTTSIVAVVAYVALSVGLASGDLPYPPDQDEARYLRGVENISFTLLSTTVGLALVAVLAGTLAERLRRAGGALLRATESARSLARLNDDIVRSITSGLATTDLAGTIETVNPAAAAMFGATADSLVGRRVSSLLPLDEAAGDAHRGEGEAHREDGTAFLVGWNATRLLDEGDAVIGKVYSFQDLTEIVELRRAKTHADRLATLGRLAAGLAHEIRNPLSSISGSVELVRESQALDEEERNLLGVVIGEVARLNDLVTTMLQVGRPREPQRAKRDIAALVAEVVEIAKRGPAKNRRVRIEWERPERPVEAQVDGDQVRQVVWNLLKNAIEASPTDSRVDVRVVGDDAGATLVEIQDQGQGIAADERARLFETFWSGRVHGVGLGLALVKQIVDAHHATIDVESEPGKGATFRVTFPAAA